MADRRSATGLAILGATPAFSRPLHVGRPNIGNREALHAALDDVLDRRWLTNRGPVVMEFEQRIADYLGVKHCVAMCNATVALEILIRAVELSGEVIVPSFTFVATAHALQWQQITPVFADVSPGKYTLDPDSVRRMVTPRTTGIVGVHTWGHVCDVPALQSLADELGLTLLFDAAHAFGCSYRGRMVGGFAQAEVLSFHATKFLNTFEGGAVVTNDDELADKVRLMQNFGFSGVDRVVYIGTNGKMNEMSAAMGLCGLTALESFIEINRVNLERYSEGISAIAGLSMLPFDEGERQNYQYVVVNVDEDVFGVSRDEVVEILQAEGVLARRYFYPGCHRMEPYHSLFPHAGLLLPLTEALCTTLVQLPTGTAVGPTDIDTICEILAAISEHRREVRRRLGTADRQPPSKGAARASTVRVAKG